MIPLLDNLVCCDNRGDKDDCDEEEKRTYWHGVTRINGVMR